MENANDRPCGWRIFWSAYVTRGQAPMDLVSLGCPQVEVYCARPSRMSLPAVSILIHLRLSKVSTNPLFLGRILQHNIRRITRPRIFASSQTPSAQPVQAYVRFTNTLSGLAGQMRDHYLTIGPELRDRTSNRCSVASGFENGGAFSHQSSLCGVLGRAKIRTIWECN